MNEKRDFGAALVALKNGYKLQREGWNGKNMFIFMRPEDTLPVDFIVDTMKSLPQSVKDYYKRVKEQAIALGGGPTPVKFTGYLCMKAADNTIVNGWLASQTDMLAEDWTVIE
jgi:chitinase